MGQGLNSLKPPKKREKGHDDFCAFSNACIIYWLGN